MSDYFKHETALIECSKIGTGSRIWAFTHILKGAEIGKNCNIGDHCFIEFGVIIGDNVTIKNNTTIWEGVSIQQNVFVGPNVTFVNDPFPRSPRLALVANKYKNKKWMKETMVREGASIGANATILCGVDIGDFAMVGAGTLVTKNVPAYSLVYGNPGKVRGYVCRCGEKLNFDKSRSTCDVCNSVYNSQRQGGGTKIELIKEP